MSKVSQKYPINRLQNTYYEVTIDSGLFSTKKDHDFYINGRWYGLGFFDEKKSLYYKNLVDDLNSNFSLDSATTLKSELSSNTCSMILKMLDGLEVSEDWHESYGNGLGFYPGYCWGTYKMSDGLPIKRLAMSRSCCTVNTERNSYQISFKGDNGFYNLKRFILIYVLVNLPHTGSFRIKNDLSCIDVAVSKGWLKP